MNNPNRPLTNFLAGWCGVIMACVFAGCDDSSQAPATRYRKPVTPARKASGLPSGVLDRLRGPLPASDAVAAVRELIGSPLLKDPAVAGMIAIHFRDCPPELLAEVLQKWPYEFNSKSGFVNYLKTFLNEMTDVETIGKYIKPLPHDRSRAEILQHLAKYSPLLSPQTLAGFLAMTETEGDRDQLGIGLATRLGAMTAETRVTAAQEYLDLNPPVEIARALVEISMYSFAKGDPARTTEWLLRQSGDVAGGADLVLMGKLGATPEARTVAVNFIQQLIDDDQTERAGRAVEAMAGGFSASSPQESLAWVLQLPDSLGIRKVRAATSAWLALRDRNPGVADQLVSTVTNPDIIRAIQVYRDEAAKVPPP